MDRDGMIRIPRRVQVGGLKGVTISLLWDLCMYHDGTWTLWVQTCTVNIKLPWVFRTAFMAEQACGLFVGSDIYIGPNT